MPLSVPGLGLPGLAEISVRDKVWDEHKGCADQVAALYGGGDFDIYRTRITFCADLLEFRLVMGEGCEFALKLSGARFCRVRYCPTCQWRRALMWKARAYAGLPKLLEAFPKHRWLFLTLTVRNCPVGDLRATVKAMNAGMIRLTDRKAWPAVGWIRTLEVTKSKNDFAHPHFHCLLLVPPGYFGKPYLSQSKWTQLWEESIRVDYKPVIHVRAVRPDQDALELIPEVLKYQVKESDLVDDREWLEELTRQMHKTRAIGLGGVFRQYLREVKDEPEDLIGLDDQAAATGDDQATVNFAWKKAEQHYQSA